MPVKTSRKIHLRTISSKTRQSRTYADRWDLSHLAKDPVQRFETLLGEIAAKVAQFESSRNQAQSTNGTSVFHRCGTSEDIAAASSKIGASATTWFPKIRKTSPRARLRPG